ncbi:MAG: hypothetical protein J6U43_06590, partial [Bacteroidales bacterium]|nr:hypothetical protein [Bacteroidales bacterium]
MIQDESKNKNAREEDENPMLRAVYNALGGQGNERNYAQTLELKVPIYAVGDVNMDDVMRRSEILPYRPREEWGNLVYRPKRNKLIEQMLG